MVSSEYPVAPHNKRVAACFVLPIGTSNSQNVEIDWAFGESTGPLWVVIAGSALLGAVIGDPGRGHGVFAIVVPVDEGSKQ